MNWVLRVEISLILIGVALNVVGNRGYELRADTLNADSAVKYDLSVQKLNDNLPNVEGNSENPAKRRPFVLRLLEKALDVDTNYIERDKYNVTLMVQSDWRYKLIELSGRDGGGKEQTLYFHPHSQVIIGPYVGYSLLCLGWTVDIGSNLTTRNSNLYLSLYAPMFGIDYYHERDINGYKISRLSGFDSDVIKASEGLRFPGLSTNMKYAHLYYIFNHRHFSYPAAYSQTNLQRRSSGAMILGYSYSRQNINFDYSQLPPPFYDENGNLAIAQALKVGKIRYTNHSVSLGYTYNWVFARNFLFNVSASPAIGYNFTKGEHLTSEKIYRLSNLNFDFVGKLGFVWNCQRLFAGGSFTAHTYAYRQSTFICQNSLLSAQLYMGVKLWRKKPGAF